MSACIFIASDIPLVEVAPSQKYPLHIDIDNGTLLYKFSSQTYPEHFILSWLYEMPSRNKQKSLPWWKT